MVNAERCATVAGRFLGVGFGADGPPARVAIWSDALAGLLRLQLLARRHGRNDHTLGIDAEVRPGYVCWPEKGAFRPKISLQGHAFNRTG